MATEHPSDTLSSVHEAGAAQSAAPSWDFAGSIQGDAPPQGRGHPRVPDAIERRYLRVHERYFFPDRTLAFIDDGRRIRVRTENREVLHSVVAIAESRGWRVVQLRGTKSFRQALWREAALRGIQVRGYQPTELELVEVERALNRTHPPRIPEATSEKTTGERASGAPASERARPLRQGPRPPVKGLLMAAAAAPYLFDPAQRMSYYVTVRTEVGERTIWGADLERALAESASRPRIGDPVVLTPHGTRPVDVRVPTRNAAGELVGEKKIVAQRARWTVETQAHVRAMEQGAQFVRTGELLSGSAAAAALGQQPWWASAAAGLKLAQQYARRVTAHEPSQQRLVQAIRDRMADALGQGRQIHLPERRARPGPVPVPVRQRMPRSREEPIHERP